MSTADQQQRPEVASLVHESGNRAVAVMAPGIVTIGRENADLRIPNDPYLSQTHARIELHQHGCTLRDCGSMNGTFVEVRGSIELRPGDEIIIGDQLFRVAV